MKKVQYKKVVGPLRIFRLEHPDSGKGPYTHQSRSGFASDAMRYIQEPIEMGYRGCAGHHFAFETVATMMGAIDRLTLLHEHGFHVQVYDVKEAFVFVDGQVAFTRSEAELISSARVKEFPWRDHA